MSRVKQQEESKYTTNHKRERRANNNSNPSIGPRRVLDRKLCYQHA